MRRLIVIMVLALSCLPFAARAQAPGSPQAQAAAEDLLKILSGDMLTQMSNAMMGQVWPQIEAELAGKADQAAMAELRDEFGKALQRFLVESMKGAPALYAKYFSEQELRDMAAFYKTPSGAKALQMTPTVTAEFFGSLMPRMQQFQSEIEGIVKRIMEKRGIKR